MERSPDTIDTSEIAQLIEATEGVAQLRDLKVWSINDNKTLATVKVRPDKSGNAQLLKRLRLLLTSQGVFYSTIEIS